MATKSKVVYVCSECGYETAKWMGKCPSCNSWSTLTEDIRLQSKQSSVSGASSNMGTAKPLSEINVTQEERYVTGVKELDRVLGGGIVKGSGILLSGDPGIGKSTILLQICNALQNSLNILYVSGKSLQFRLKCVRIVWVSAMIM